MKISMRALSLLLPLAFAGCGSRECYVGVSGTAASITVKGMFPDDTCKALILDPARYIGEVADDSPRRLYSMSERPTQPVVCEHTVDSKRFVVRDDGMLKVVGNIVCSALSRRAD